MTRWTGAPASRAWLAWAWRNQCGDGAAVPARRAAALNHRQAVAGSTGRSSRRVEAKTNPDPRAGRSRASSSHTASGTLTVRGLPPLGHLEGHHPGVAVRVAVLPAQGDHLGDRCG